MSTTIDRKVVEMQFDNKQFESGIATTMSSLDKFKQGLKFTGATQGLAEVNGAIKNVNMSGLGSAIETVQAKFSALSVMGVTALANLTNSAVNAGKRIVSALTIQPITTGFNEYETKINAIQTIMSNTASKGTTMEDVTRVIGELNTYADKTIYNFAEMTRNIGTFTAAGVGLEDSASAIQGIANLAAASGSNSQQASTAMYQLSQALAAGSVKLMDWNSVVNAGMGGEKFQEALKATAREHGIAVDDIIEKNGSFRESLSEGWISADILNTTLKKFTVEGAKDYAKSMLESGKYTQEQADALLKEAQSMEDAATKVKTFTQLWDTLKESAQSGWSQTWEIIVGDFEEAKSFLTELSDTFGGIINSASEARNKVLQGWKDLGGRADLIDALRNAFKGIASVVAPIKDAFTDIFPEITAKKLFGFTKGLKEFTAKLTLSDTASENLKKTFAGMFAVIDIVRQAFVAIIDAVMPMGSTFSGLGGGLLSITAGIGDFLVKLSETTKKTGVFTKSFKLIGSVIRSVVDVAVKLGKALSEKIVFPGLKGLNKVLDGILTGITKVIDGASGIGEGIKEGVSGAESALSGSPLFEVFRTLGLFVSTVAKGIATAFGIVADSIGEHLSNANFEGFFDFVKALVTGGLGVGLMKIFNSASGAIDNFGGMFEGVKGILDGVRGCFEEYQNQLKAGTLIKIATAIAILAASILVISTIDNEKLTVALGAIAALFGELVLALSTFNKIGYEKGIIKTSIAMIGVSTAVLILASAVKSISSIDENQMKAGLLGVLALLGEIALFLTASKFGNVSLSSAVGMIAIAAAIKILASACGDFGKMPSDQLIKGIVSIGGLLIVLASFANLTSGLSNIFETGIALIAIAAAMKIFASAAKDFGGMSWEAIAKGLVGMSGALIAVTAALNLMPSDTFTTSVGLIAVSTALLILSAAMSNIGSMSWEEIAKGLVAITAAIAVFALGLNAMTGTLSGSAALLVATAALAVLAPVMMLLGTLSWEAIAKGLTAMAGAILIIGVAGMLLAPYMAAIVGLGTALAGVGVGMLAIGASILVAGLGLTAIAAGFAALAAAAPGAEAIVEAIKVIISGVISLIPEACVAIGEGIIAICGVIVDGADSVKAAFVAVFTALIGALSECVSPLMSFLGVLLEGILKFLIDYTPKVTEAALLIIAGFLDGIAKGLPKVIQSAINLVISFIDGMANGIRDNTDRVINAMDNLLDAMLDAIVKFISFRLNVGPKIISKLTSGIKEGTADMRKAGKDALQGFINGIKDKLSAAANAAKSVGSAALGAIKKVLGINSPAREFIKVGKFADEGMIVGLKALAGKVARSASNVGDGALTAMKDTFSSMAATVNKDIDAQPTIRPIVDLSGVRTGMDAIDHMLDMGSSVDVMANVGTVSAMMKRYNRSGGNGDVVSAINDLRKDIGKIKGDSYNIDGVTYDDGSNVSNAVKAIIRAAKVERRT